MNTSSIFIETPRLIIRQLLPEDEAGMFEMDSDPEVHRYLGNTPQQSIEESRAYLTSIQRQYQDNGIGRWAVLLKDTGAFIGWTGFKKMTEPVNGHVDHYDFGYRHLRKYWGNGFAIEAAKVSLDYGLQILALKDIFAMTHTENAGSRHILEKLGFKLIEIFPYDGQLVWMKGQSITWYEYKTG